MPSMWAAADVRCEANLIAAAAGSLVRGSRSDSRSGTPRTHFTRAPTLDRLRDVSLDGQTGKEQERPNPILEPRPEREAKSAR
jgi:hypothetical protein